MIRCSEAVCRNLEVAGRREWLETNALGGYAFSTIIGLNTRSYHGLLVAAAEPPVRRQVLLAKLEETVLVDGQRFELSTNQYRNVVHPKGYLLMTEFRLDPFPIFVYEAGGVRVEKSVFMVHGENTTVIQYKLQGRPASLEVRPLIAGRDHHSLRRRNIGFERRFFKSEQGWVGMKRFEESLPLFLAHNAREFRPTNYWYFNFNYERERDRGLREEEDLFNPFVLKFAGDATIIVSSSKLHSWEAAEGLRSKEIERRKKTVETAPCDDRFVRELVSAADQFIVERREYRSERQSEYLSVIAGYPWFTDWGRDAMIALPGLTLVTGRPEAARNILLAFGSAVDRGMLPNRFPDTGQAAEYETADASLWFLEAIRAYLAYTGDYDFIRKELYGKLVEIIRAHRQGTRYCIHTDPSDGLLETGGCRGLTWMDADPGDGPVTPRYGKAVEIQALWYNGLRVMESLAGKFGDEDGRKRYEEMAILAQSNFEPLFWNEDAGCLLDVVDGESRDSSIRPNQILAVSLPYSMLSAERARSVVATVERELLTPFGLRTLSPEDPRYHGRYEGDLCIRDRAYHQGTAWPWLMGPFLTAYVKVHGGTAEARKQAGTWLEALRNHLESEGLGQLPEVFDGDSPQRPDGCIAQAWSVAEVLRTMAEDVLSLAPHS